jgi:hypothetical protein
MTGWVLLSDRDQPLVPGLPPALPKGTLVVELAWPLPTGVLLDWHDGAGHALSLFHHPQSGLGLMRRDASGVRRHMLPAGLETDARLARLLFRWDAAERLWSLRLDDAEGRSLGSACGQEPGPLPLPMLAALCQGVTRRDAAVLWYGVTDSPVPPPNRAWIGRATPVATVTGDVPAALLRPGDWVLTRDAGPVRLRAVVPLDLPSRGSHAAIVLRAPYYARQTDLLVSASQRVVLGGPEAEYLFGDEEVLVSAGALADGRSAITDSRRVTTPSVALDLGGAHLIEAGGCALLAGAPEGTLPMLPLRAIEDYEAPPLMALLRKMRPGAAA